MNPYGNNGFARLNQQQRQPNPQQQRPAYGQPYGQPYQQGQPYAQPGFQQPMQQQYTDPRFQQQQYVDPRFQQQMQQPYGQPMYQRPIDPRFQQPIQQPFGQPYGQPGYQQPYRATMGQQQAVFGRTNTPQQYQQSLDAGAEKTFSSMVEDVKITPVNQNPIQTTQNTQQTQIVKKPVCEYLSPADGHEFPPYYDKDTEKLEKVIDEKTCTYTWKIVKGGK